MILFKKHFVPIIKLGGKTQTRRPGKKRWNEGSIHQVQCGYYGQDAFGFVLVTKVYQERLGDISEEDARAEGFYDRDHFLTAYFDINKKREPMLDEEVWVIHFEYLGERKPVAV